MMFYFSDLKPNFILFFFLAAETFFFFHTELYMEFQYSKKFNWSWCCAGVRKRA